MVEKIKTDVCVIGAGSGGLSLAFGAVQMGANVVLIEKGKMGGDCLNYGCVPSKSLLAMAHRNSDFIAAHKHVQQVIKTIAPKDSVERFTNLGVKVIQGEASFINKKEIKVNDKIVYAKYFVIATGSKPRVPPISNLDKINYLTNETIFDLKYSPRHLIIIGGGPIGCEMAQAHKLLGSKVSLIQRSRILSKDDSELTAVVRKRLIENGVDIYENLEIISVNQNDDKIIIKIKHNNQEKIIIGSHLLVAVGRKPDIENLNLAKAQVVFNKKGIMVDKKLRSTNKTIYAIGDVIGGYQFTHISNYHASVVLRNILFHLAAKVNYHAVSWVTYTNPELAHVGLYEQDAREKHGTIKILSLPFDENDRAQAEGDVTGLIKVIAKKNGQILGASIVGNKAGELIDIWCLAISKKLKLKDIATCIIPYPTRGEISKQVAGSFYASLLFSSKMRKLVRFLLWLFG